MSPWRTTTAPPACFAFRTKARQIVESSISLGQSETVLAQLLQFEDPGLVSDLDAGIEEMLDSKGPFVLEVMVPHQEHVLPMIPSGQTVREIIKA